jgi:hypothetical protein
MEAPQRLTALRDSPDVTLASQDKQGFCKFHQSGHCKFGETCKNFHTNHTCPDPQCKDSACTARHPRLCIFYMRFGHCKFNSVCSYRHIDSIPDSSDTLKCLEKEIMELKETLVSVIATLKNKEKEIEVQEQRITKLESDTKTFKCTLCEYESVTSTALKTHVTKKHKPEQFRAPCGENDLEVSIHSCDREENTSTSLSDKHKHINFKDFLSEDQPDTCHFCKQTFHNTDTFKNHMIDFHELLTDGFSNCIDCEESFKDTNIAQYIVCIDGEVAARCLECQDLAITG